MWLKTNALGPMKASDERPSYETSVPIEARNYSKLA